MKEIIKQYKARIIILKLKFKVYLWPVKVSERLFWASFQKNRLKISSQSARKTRRAHGRPMCQAQVISRAHMALNLQRRKLLI